MLWIIIWVIVVLSIYVVSQYNGIIKLRNNRENAFADIDTQLKLRFDLVPNLVNTVKWYAKHEKELLENVTKARTEFLGAGSVDAKMDANNMLTNALKSMFAVSENYPDLKANQNFMQMQTELSDIENKIAASRRFFNSATKEFNNHLETFPTNIIGGMFNFSRMKSFELENREEESKSVEVKF